MSLDMNTATKTNYSTTRLKLPKIKRKIENIEVVGKKAHWRWLDVIFLINLKLLNLSKL